MTPFIKEVSTEAEFSAVVDCLWEGYYNPYGPLINILFPVFSATEEGYADAVAESKIRLWSIHTADPSSHWIYITDETGKVHSGAHWNFHEVSPYLNGTPKLEAFWYPEGDGRKFASHILGQVYGSRGKRMWRPHAQLDMMFTYPEQRRKGYASMLMEWGMTIAEKMGVEVLVELVIKEIDNPSNTWKRFESDLRGTALWWMWKPANGVYEEGKTVVPWIAKPEVP